MLAHNLTTILPAMRLAEELETTRWMHMVSIASARGIADEREVRGRANTWTSEQQHIIGIIPAYRFSFATYAQKAAQTGCWAAAGVSSTYMDGL
jgi:hypothetical protein